MLQLLDRRAAGLPRQEEAGCLGSIIQAKYAYGHSTGRTENFRDLSSRLVLVDEDKTALPDPAKGAAYRAAQEAYDVALHTQYPQLRNDSSAAQG